MDSDYLFGIFWPLCCLFFKEEQTTQWPKDTKGAIRICISKKNRQHNGQKIPKGQSKSVYQRRTDNTMDKQRSTKHTCKTYDIPELVVPIKISLIEGCC
jgi:hypothetical protein